MTPPSFDYFITDTLQLVDVTINAFVNKAFINLGGYINGLMMALATVYIMFFGLQVLYQKVNLELMTMVKTLSLLVIVMALTTHGPLYHLLVYNIFTNEPVHLSQYLLGGADNATSAINQLWSQGCLAGGKLFSAAGINNLSNYAYGIAIFVATFLNAFVALCLFVIAKLSVAILLALGPVFLLFLLWDSTREIFAGWLKALINYALIPVITTSVLLLTNQLMLTTLPGLSASASNPKLQGLMPFFALSLMSGYLLRQVMSLAAGLSGSISLDGIGQVAGMAGLPFSKMKQAHAGHQARQDRRLRMGKPIGMARVKNTLAKARSFRGKR